MSDFVQAEQVVGSRYRLKVAESEQPANPGASLWRATDTTLRREVRILVLNPSMPEFSETLDAARRASLFDDPHAVHILSVGSDFQFGWVVTEVPLGVPVAYRLTGTPLDRDQARAIVGEAATILASARSRGIRHLQLSPADVRIDTEGQVFLDGLATKAALAGMHTDSMLSNELDRLEAAGLADVYASLLLGSSEGDAAERYAKLEGDESLPDSLRFFFEKEAGGAGCLSASDTIRTLAPWPPIDVSALPYVPGTEPVEYAAEELDPELGIGPQPAMAAVPKWPSATGDAPASPAVAFPPVGGEGGASAEGAGAVGAGGAGDSAGAGAEGGGTAAAGDASAEAAGGEDAPTAASGPDAPSSASSPGEGVPTADSADGPASSDSQAGAPKAGEPATAGTPSEAERPKRSGLSSLAAKTADSTRHLSQGAAAGVSKMASSRTAQAARTSWEKQADKVSVKPEEGGPRRYNVSWLFMAISLVLVVGAGAWAVSLFTTPPKVNVTYQGPTGGPLDRDAGDLPSARAETPEPGAPVIESATLLNPHAGNLPVSEGAQQDNPDAVVNAVDDDTSTVWASWWYPTANYTAGKDGIGIKIKLAEPVDVTNVHLQVNGNGGNVQWRATTEDDPAGGDVLAESAMSTATYLVPAAPVATDTIILWFNELPRDATDKSRLAIAEINFNKQIPEALRTAPATAGDDSAAAGEGAAASR